MEILDLRLQIADLGRHRAWGIEHRVRSQEPESRIQEKSNQNRFPLSFCFFHRVSVSPLPRVAP
jgi:hypothetical protein